MNLVTGATGLVGIRIAFDLLSSGEMVLGLKRKDSDLDFVKSCFLFYDPKRGRALFNRLRWHDADLLDIERLETAFENVISVYHCAALVSHDKRDKEKLLETNYEGTRNIVNLCLGLNVESLCHISSVAALGKTRNKQLVSEHSLWNDETNGSTYGLSKHLAEMEVWRGISEGLNAVIVNPSVILAPYKESQSSGKLISLLKRGSVFYPDGATGYIDVRDVSEVSISLMRAKSFGERYILNSENLSFREILRMSSILWGGKSPRYRVGSYLLIILGWINRFASILTGSRPKISPETAQSASTKKFYDNSKIREELSFSFISIESSLKYYREFAP